MSDHIINASRSIIYEFDKSYTGSIVVSNTSYKSIYYRACFSGKLTSLDLSKSSIESIGGEASVKFPDSLILLDWNAFAVTGLSSIHLGPNLRYFSGYAFNQCSNLNTFSVDENNNYFSVVNNFVLSKNMSKIIRSPINFEVDDIPNKENIITIGDFAFSGATFEKFVGWKNLKNIDGAIFHGTKSLEIVDLSLTKIEHLKDSNFCSCPNLIMINLPSFLKEIQYRALYQVPKLVSISIPSSVTVLNNSCFNEMKSLKVVCYYGNVSFSGRSLFYNCPSMKYIRVCSLYPSNKFSSFDVSYDAYQLGETILTCPSIKNIPCSSIFHFMSYSVFILL